ncbi:hypothetical protein PCANC_14097 [Puccinia coronata f. sp. avenae]|uniref:C2H2-type domain-containing protein n=1 Tax=Puccinia coronata f. sp. avenae TaxID=200324 RepID=A0A2N5VRS4_9BASI|nr:hypothetical protein PCASD_08343 [Puccinia coronata f. sp. avenae]PLW52670.1 hypothetical protein PCANC_14097 [Puccinia coronata f. sp. avenae]
MASLVCKWAADKKAAGVPCQMRFARAEELFNHLCVDHVGRKRHGNLSLLCCWETCEHKAAKRDHMTSHMMVHCPLQTNVCGICSKTFKRSYDLRKHEVTHTTAHHQTHTRSRALIYDEVDQLGQPPTPASEVHNNTMIASHDFQLGGSSSLPTIRSASARGNINNNKPYLRPGCSSASSTPSKSRRRRSFDTMASIDLQVEHSSNPYKSFNSLDPIPYPLVHHNHNIVYQDQQPHPPSDSMNTSSDGGSSYLYYYHYDEQAATSSSTIPYTLPAPLLSDSSSLVSFPAFHPDSSSLNDTLADMVNQINDLANVDSDYFQEYMMNLDGCFI